MGCRYVPTVVGGPAAVLPQGETLEGRGGGLWYDHVRLEETGESEGVGFGYFLFTYQKGLGHGVDVQGGWNGIRPFGVVRWQALGKPQTPGVRDGGPFDLSLEAGTSAMVFYDVRQLDGHLGLNASTRLPGVTPYLTYRYHWAHSQLYDHHEEQWHMLYFGAEFRRTGQTSSTVVEFFYGTLNKFDPVFPDDLRANRYGLNVIVRKAKW
jgi:hypothetical protein